MSYVFRRPFDYRARRRWIGTAAPPAAPTIDHTLVIYAFPGGRSGPPGTIEL